MPIIYLSTEIKAPIQICFDLARSIDLHKLSMKHTNEKAIAGRVSGLIELGESVTWQAKHFGIKQQLTSKITGFTYPVFFRDEMTKGVFKRINHEHWFLNENGHTVMTDVFEFESPYGFFGKVFNNLILYDYLRQLLENRNALIKLIAEGGQWKSLLNYEQTTSYYEH
ncbi:cell division protein [Solitalea longa]|uniref:Cell division protein n=1 Tax=Solitalea longa TaxID=2079460 RepID=A0A2S5A8X3_9SPHI|nr:SRPBCC family protein [Solitalea longa]POY38954.1 cell division protein [Solitalea longa]